VLTHDVESPLGQDKCLELAEMEEKSGFYSSFYFVPERYAVSKGLRNYLVNKGFEVGVHDLNHDGRLFSSRKVFSERLQRINGYLRDWNATGFRAGAMHHNLQWIGELDVSYDCSTFDTDPFEPQPDGVRTIFPFRVNRSDKSGYFVEIPYTLPQDFTLFILLKHSTIDIWKRKLDWIVQKGGMAFINTHPDYMSFDNVSSREEYPCDYYLQFLRYVQQNYENEYWNALPSEVASYVNNSSCASLNMSDEMGSID
jgi:hypothetical protein